MATGNQISAPRWNQARASAKVFDGAGTMKSFKEFVYAAVRNILRERSWDSTKSGPPSTLVAAGESGTVNAISTQTSYDGFGNPLQLRDPRLFITDLTYGTLSNCSPTASSATNLYPTQRKLAIGTSAERIFTIGYDCVSGSVTSETDAHNGVTTVSTYDPIGRLLTRTEAGLRQETYEYRDAEYATVTRRSLNTVNDGSLSVVISMTFWAGFIAPGPRTTGERSRHLPTRPEASWWTTCTPR
jgi:YD repeat-containing protein